MAVWIQARHWFQQQQWSRREKYYMQLLSSLSQLKVSLEDRSEYFDEPGSVFDTSRSESERFRKLVTSGDEAMASVRQQVGPASVFLSAGAAAALNDLIREHWHTTQDSVCTADYTNAALALVTKAYTAVLEEARNHLLSVRDS